jgi:hypothetical protein
METNTDMGLKDLDKLEELQRVQKRLTEVVIFGPVFLYNIDDSISFILFSRFNIYV